MTKNRKGRYEQLRTLLWDEATAKSYDRSTGHGRLETRVVQAPIITNLGIDFPRTAQVAKIVRTAHPARAGKCTREDTSKIRVGHGPKNMATIRSFGINQLRAAGHADIAAGLGEMSLRPFEQPLALLGLSRPAPTQDHRALQSP